MKAQVLIVGSMPCCICGEMMTQKDVDNQEAIFTGTNPTIMNVAAHLRHFYQKEKNFLPTADYELSMAKFAFAAAEEMGWKTQTQKLEAMSKIKKLEKKYGRN